ncbi:MAG: hypothetical protein Q7J60_12110 [Bradyrhizobium sp.]|uniref:hypothetical protein n=1 Tax=Bradyrhizobium sp. TaxID=376 RepID=UPI0027264D8A|nr:hypothetical protein [Bradyrhizobium sp.]MDO9562361.1 hypothetical protein [Bradyrhizobium sp.]MDP1535533.1 hypothetical protein [Rubrivivax sp.]MDP3691446.1 hypothetical protein [Bradyrhizobium sp.]
MQTAVKTLSMTTGRARAIGTRVSRSILARLAVWFSPDLLEQAASQLVRFVT